MRVSFVDPGVEVRMLGGLGPLQMMGLHGAMSWRFEPRQDGGTVLVSGSLYLVGEARDTVYPTREVVVQRTCWPA